MNNVESLLEHLCSGNGQQQLYNASINTYKMNKHNVYLTSEDNNKDYVCVKPGISRSQKLEESLKSKVFNNLFAKPKDRTVPIGNVFEARYM